MSGLKFFQERYVGSKTKSFISLNHFSPWRTNVIEPRDDSFDRISNQIDINRRRKFEPCKVCIYHMLHINYEKKRKVR